jgi:hypothetical protein
VNIYQADVESRERTWTVLDVTRTPVAPTAISFVVRGVDGTLTFAEGTGVVNNGDGTGTWTIEAGDLEPGHYEWWALATIEGEDVLVRNLAGKIEIEDR